MIFLGCVPAAVRAHVCSLNPVLTAIIESPKGGCPTIVREYFQNNLTHHERPRPSFQEEHLATIIDAWRQPEWLREHKECLLRLTQDDRMREAYALLGRDFIEDEQWHKLVWAATTANLDFRCYRADLFNAIALMRAITENSQQLALLLRELECSAVFVPSLHWISALLSHYDNYTDDELLEQIPMIKLSELLDDVSEIGGATVLNMHSRGEPTIDKFGWHFEDFPHFSLGTEIVAAAVSSRQRNHKTEYLRGFMKALNVGDPIVLATNNKKAMAIVADVVLNDPDEAVSYEDVRSLLRTRKPRTGNSPKKKQSSSPENRDTQNRPKP